MKAFENNDHSRKPEDFPPGYGKFPYIMVKIGHARYVQLPIHRRPKEEDPELEGIFISEQNQPSPEVQRQHNLDSLMKVRKKHFDQNNIYLPMCLMEGPSEAIYVDEQGNISENSSIPIGGVLLTGSHKIISLHGSHHYNVE